MLSLAPLKYTDILGNDDAPIGRLEFGKVSIQGKPMFQANAFLKQALQYKKKSHDYYSNADGCGTHRSPMQARYVAISEALERWALYHTSSSSSKKEYGFDIDNTSTGMAAFPGFLKSQARSKALSEAAERFCLISWWAGRLNHKPLETQIKGLQGIEIDNPISQDRVIVLWKMTNEGYYAYGFSADKTVNSAILKGTIELDRSEKVLNRVHTENPGFTIDDLNIIGNHQERRVIYYSIRDGHEVFQKRLSAQVKNEIKPPVSPIIDTEIKGPWSKYATVWRVLFQMPTQKHLDPNSYYFFW